ncbi:hypothetical protein SAMN04489740_0732 [Arthrobacter alpinus]|uniref:Uncharacterized protein n=1 Tax=Arthrobacter alpinus TaxID=656366 RepID=A0A1H5GEH5_9MICC|nr:hypothetical protein [Arthrobacter alpinus]SEE13538.1 hypothetical protein SAMN04489740_0732 [Arthrobacter alpinus]
MNSSHQELGVDHPRGLGHTARREWYLLKVDLFLDGRVPGRRRKEILNDLRNIIDAESDINTLQEVISGLGQPSALAASYAEGTSKKRVLWTAGVAAGMAALMVYWILGLTYTLGMLSVAHQAGGEFNSHFFSVDVLAFSTPEGIGIGWSGDAALWIPLGLAALAFIGASRAWRVFRRRPS